PEGESKGLHQGIDILAPNGTEVKSVSDKGRVMNISTTEGGYLGKMVEVEYKNATVIYGNLGSVDVKKGQEIKKGDKIGTAGGTTESGEVMHLEVVYKGQRVDATPFVTGEGTQTGGGNGTST
ncbi:M23 family metallopeptidase, partial [Bacillus cereus group sp. BfR-BA-01382]|uniref:M23 family metallopeptidase n=1 Tax=Bacillus cereus group sp. BfR-BA-01382 TaxID=2920326 RepID=UPI001F59C88B